MIIVNRICIICWTATLCVTLPAQLLQTRKQENNQCVDIRFTKCQWASSQLQPTFIPLPPRVIWMITWKTTHVFKSKLQQILRMNTDLKLLWETDRNIAQSELSWPVKTSERHTTSTSDYENQPLVYAVAAFLVLLCSGVKSTFCELSGEVFSPVDFYVLKPFITPKSKLTVDDNQGFRAHKISYHPMIKIF